MRFSRFAVLALFFTMVSLGQNDRGTITGTVMDPANASIPAAAVVARNLGTGVQYEAATTETGNYTVAQLPAGVYEVSVTAAGFAKFTQQGITVQVAQTAPVNVVMKVGAATDSVTVTATPTGLATGAYSGTVTLSSPNSIPAIAVTVNLVVGTVTGPALNAVANAASYSTGSIAPGENVVLFGSGIGPAQLTRGTVTCPPVPW